MVSILSRTNDKALVDLAGPAHLAGKSSGVIAVAIMAQMELDYAQYVVEENPNDIRCILTTDAKSAFQSASRQNCYKVLCTDDTLRERFAPFFAHTHKGTLRSVFHPYTQGLSADHVAGGKHGSKAIIMFHPR